LLSNGPLLCAFNVAIKVLKKVVPSVFGIQQITVIDMFLQVEFLVEIEINGYLAA